MSVPAPFHPLHVKFARFRPPNSFPYGTKTARFLAYTIDAWVQFTAQISGAVLGSTLATMMMSPGAPVRVLQDAQSVGMVLGFTFWGVVAAFMNFVVLQGLSGGSMGKLAMKLRVVNQDGTPIGIIGSLIRSICFLASVCTAYLGFAAIFFGKRNQCLHDYLCKTVVIRKGVAYPERSELVPMIESTEDTAAPSQAA